MADGPAVVLVDARTDALRLLVRDGWGRRFMRPV
jgi:hypothetical protein